MVQEGWEKKRNAEKIETSEETNWTAEKEERISMYAWLPARRGKAKAVRGESKRGEASCGEWRWGAARRGEAKRSEAKRGEARRERAS